jgi:hypothetical protein
MTLNPSHYECPDHHTGLTALVEEALEFQGGPVAYKPGPRPFQVIVTSPGTGGTAAHPLTCTCTGTGTGTGTMTGPVRRTSPAGQAGPTRPPSSPRRLARPDRRRHHPGRHDHHRHRHPAHRGPPEMP